MVLWRFATRGLGTISTLILARLLLPADFGLVALGTAFAQSIDGLMAVGIEDALVRERAPPRSTYDTAFTLSLLRGAVTGVLVALAARPVGAFFGDPRLEDIVYILAGMAVLEGAGNIGVVEFRREFAFEKEFLLNLLPRLVGVCASIGGALTLESYWALVLGIVSTRVLRVIAGYVLHPFRPRLTLVDWRIIAGYSSWVWVISIVTLIRDRAASFVIGRTFSPAEVGIFNLGTEIAALPTSELIEPACRALFSGFAASRHGAAPAGATFLRIMALTVLVTVPAGVGIALVARPLVALAFGPQWGGAVPVMQIMAITYGISSLASISATFHSARAGFRLIMRYAVLSMVLRVGLLVVLTPRYGLVGGAVAMMLSVLVEAAGYVGGAIRELRVPLTALLGIVWRPVLATAAMGAVLGSGVWQGEGIAAGNAALAGLLAEQVALGAGTFTAALLALWFVARCPAGAEADLLEVARRVAGRVRNS